MESKIWVTKDGRELLICELEDTHVFNIIEYFSKRAWYAKIQIIKMLEFYMFNTYGYAFYNNTPDGASMAAEHEADRLSDLCTDVSNSPGLLPLSVKWIIKEALLRKLPLPDNYSPSFLFFKIDPLKIEKGN